jgi:hypothetical protein
MTGFRSAARRRTMPATARAAGSRPWRISSAVRRGPCSTMQASARALGRDTRGGRRTSSGRRAAAGTASAACVGRLAASSFSQARTRSRVDLFQRSSSSGAGCPAASYRPRRAGVLGCLGSAHRHTASDGQARCARPTVARGRQGRLARRRVPALRCASPLRASWPSAAAMRSRFSWRGSMPWSIIVCSRRASSRAARVSTLERRRWSRGQSAGSAWPRR